MKQSKVLTKILSVLLTFLFILVTNASNYVIIADANPYNDNYNNMTDAEKQAYLEQKLKEYDQKLASLDKQSKEKEEYINTLNDKISYMQKELALSKSTIETSKNKKSSLENQYKSNEQEIEALKTDISSLEVREVELQDEFDVSYDLYAKRARALYISGGVNMLEVLLTSDDMSTLFTRLEMIKQVSKADKELLESLKNEGDKLLETKSDLEAKRSSLISTQETLKATRDNLAETIKTLEIQQAGYTQKEQSYKAEKSEADGLLQELHNQEKTYSEFRNENLEELREINREIEQAGKDWADKQEESTTTTEKPSSTKPSGGESDTEKPTQKPSTTKPTTSSGRLSMTFPVPSQTKITTAYGSAGYAGHTGVDFACDSGSRVVAAEDGEVIISTDLKNSDGSYRSYGRYIVIAHNKKNSLGQYVFTLYAHNSSRVVSKGDKVRKGQLIAYSGSTGNSTGPHCHFEVRTPTSAYDDCVNPTPYLP